MSSERSKPPRTGCVFCGGELRNADRAEQAAGRADLLIAADGGANHLARLGLKPQVIVGDMDSIAPDLWTGDEQIVRMSHSTDKDRSDAELAVEYALQQGCRQVTLVAALGERLDHALANVALVAEHPGHVTIVDGHATLVAVDGPSKCVLHGPRGTVVSLIPYGPGARGVRTAGLKYSLRDQSLASTTHGLSNELTDGHGCVCVSEGVLLVYVENEEVWAVP